VVSNPTGENGKFCIVVCPATALLSYWHKLVKGSSCLFEPVSVGCMLT